MRSTNAHANGNVNGNARAPVVWTRQEVAERILQGENLVIYRGQLLRIPHSWLQAHPGGGLAILHFVGRDATDEIDAFHAEPTLQNKVLNYVIGRVELEKNENKNSTNNIGSGTKNQNLGKTGKNSNNAGIWRPLIPPVTTGWRWVKSEGKNGKDGHWIREAAVRTHEHDKSLSPSEILLMAPEKAAQPHFQPSSQEKPTQNLVTLTATAAETGPSIQTLMPPPSSLSLEQQAEYSRDFSALHRRIIDAGLYDTPYLTGYGPEIVRYLTAASIAAIAYAYGWYLSSAVFIGLLWHQLPFTVHDLGHMGVTHNWVWDRLIGIFIAGFLGGLSIGWWVDNHNIHHLVPNHPTHDPDIQHIPFFAISKSFLNNLYSSYYRRIMLVDAFASIVLRFQHQLYYFVMSLARFNLYANSYSFLFKRAFESKRARGGKWTFYAEIFAIGLFWTWYGAMLASIGNWRIALASLMISNIVPSPLHVQIVLSHFSRSTEDLGPTESFVHRQLRTTTDVICPDSIAFIHGGLHLQVTHHLFPRLPRHNLRKASFLVKEYAKERGLEYHEFGWMNGNGDVLNVLRDVAEQAKIIGMVANEEVKEASLSIHKD